MFGVKKKKGIIFIGQNEWMERGVIGYRILETHVFRSRWQIRFFSFFFSNASFSHGIIIFSYRTVNLRAIP